MSNAAISHPPVFLTMREAADLLRKKPQSVQNLMGKNVLKRGVHWFKREGEIGVLFDREALIDWVKEGTGEKQQAGILMARGYFVK
jgi:hypothetical protein